MFLAGDLGGTKTILALVSAEKGPRDPLVETRFPSSEYNSFYDIVEQFLDDNAERLAADPLVSAAFGVAGPISRGIARITNLSWVISHAELAAVLDIVPDRVRLLNDLEATANGVPYLLPNDLYTINQGTPAPESPIAVIAPGTGLGEAYLTWDGTRYRAHPSEGGHADFAPGDHVQLALLNYLAQRYEHVSVERVCSGLGIPNIYRFLRDEGRADEPAWLREALADADDLVPIIAGNALDPEKVTEICRLTMEIFVSVLGAEAGDVALVLLSRGGVYLGGGIPPRILSVLDTPHFRYHFINKGRFTELISQIPVYVILNSKTALLGAALAAIDLDEQDA